MFGAFSTITVCGLLYIHAHRFITITRVYYSRIRYNILIFTVGDTQRSHSFEFQLRQTATKFSFDKINNKKYVPSSVKENHEKRPQNLIVRADPGSDLANYPFRIMMRIHS